MQPCYICDVSFATLLMSMKAAGCTSLLLACLQYVIRLCSNNPCCNTPQLQLVTHAVSRQ